MRIFFARPLFSAAERDWNATLAAALRGAGHEVFLPQEQKPGMDAAGIFASDVGGIDRADALVAIMDGADPDSGTCREVGCAYRKKPIVLVRTDMRHNAGSGSSGYNAMLTEPATIPVGAAGGSDRAGRPRRARCARAARGGVVSDPLLQGTCLRELGGAVLGEARPPRRS